MPKTFKINHTYSTRSTCDYDQIISITIAKRTNCFVTTTDGKRLKATTDCEGNESVMPYGRYSMAPCVRAINGEYTQSAEDILLDEALTQQAQAEQWHRASEQRSDDISSACSLQQDIARLAKNLMTGVINDADCADHNLNVLAKAYKILAAAK